MAPQALVSRGYAWISLIYNPSTILWLDNGSHAPDRLRVFLKKGQRFIVVSPRVFQRCTAVGWFQP